MRTRGKGTRFRSPMIAGTLAGALMAGLALLAGLAVPAGATVPGAPAPRAAAPGGPAAGPRYGSHGWSGYAWHTSSRQVTASLRLPQVAPARNAGAAFWAGFGTGPGIEQAGFTANMAGGHLRWTAWWELYPAPAAGFGQAAYSGDYVAMTVTYRGNGWFTLTVSDITRHWTASTSRHAQVITLGTAEAIAEAYGPPLAGFGPARFDRVCAGSRAWSYGQPGVAVSPLRQGSFTVLH